MFGRFTGSVISEWLPDGRNMRLVEPFEFTDPDGRRWPVPAGTIVDGASIPRFFWRVIGAPLEGKYRRASVVHDFYCEEKARDFRHVHRMFWFACRADGAGWLKAGVMYLAVRWFGPRW